MTKRDSSRLRLGALAVSTVAVLALAVGFDLLGSESPTHTLTVALAALIVGVGRWRLRERDRGLFAVANVVVLVQPAVHALSEATHAAAETLPHAEPWTEDLSRVALHLAVALIVVVIAVSEPVYVSIAASVQRVFAMLASGPREVGVRPLWVRRHIPRTTRVREQILGCGDVSRRGPPLAPRPTS